MRAIQRILRIAIATMLLGSCGGGGGGAPSTQNEGKSTCVVDQPTVFFEVTQSCVAAAVNTFQASVDLVGSLGYADGSVGGGDGGGQASDGGDGGGAGAGDSVIKRISRGVTRWMTAFAGIRNAQAAQSFSACGSGVSPSDLNKLTKAGCMYPLSTRRSPLERPA